MLRLSLRDLEGFIELWRDVLFVLFTSCLLFFFLWLEALGNGPFDPFMAPLVFGLFECPISFPVPNDFFDGPLGNPDTDPVESPFSLRSSVNLGATLCRKKTVS